ncbi:hypothetical protein ACFS6H_14205 [Terrimonas rubra]|uniref:Uncharacterized protein n=1 Tax=Terrimonas rubra TaxID=1035890 RepID=A0ABW6A6I7_9BACT
MAAIFAAQLVSAQDTAALRTSIKEQLTVPFGTLVKMEVEVVDGDDLRKKELQGVFLFKIKAVDSVVLHEPVIMIFKDETDRFPDDGFSLYRHLYGKKRNKLTTAENDEMKRKYVGKSFTIMGYESGAFTGIPDDYFKYQPVRQDNNFYFRHYLVVVADLSKTGQ